MDKYRIKVEKYTKDDVDFHVWCPNRQMYWLERECEQEHKFHNGKNSYSKYNPYFYRERATLDFNFVSHSWW